jgi:hypothetical protein
MQEWNAMAKVKVYWNVRAGLWSVMDARTRRVLGSATQVLIRDATFLVSEAGRERVKRERCKNVHAFVIGDLEAAIWHSAPEGAAACEWDWKPMHNNYLRNVANQRGIRVTYNPYRDQGFREVLSGRPVDNSPAAYLTWDCAGSEDLTPKPRVMMFDPGCEHNENKAA